MIIRLSLNTDLKTPFPEFIPTKKELSVFVLITQALDIYSAQLMILCSSYLTFKEPLNKFFGILMIHLFL